MEGRAFGPAPVSENSCHLRSGRAPQRHPSFSIAMREFLVHGGLVPLEEAEPPRPETSGAHGPVAHELAARGPLRRLAYQGAALGHRGDHRGPLRRGGGRERRKRRGFELGRRCPVLGCAKVNCGFWLRTLTAASGSHFALPFGPIWCTCLSKCAKPTGHRRILKFTGGA